MYRNRSYSVLTFCKSQIKENRKNSALKTALEAVNGPHKTKHFIRDLMHETITLEKLA
jgi:hypothetical protein